MLATTPSVAQITTAFTYQGKLEQSGTLADGHYDFRFTLWDAESNGTQLQGPVEDPGIPVNGGLFTAHIDFGNVVFGGQNVWLQIEVAEAGTGTFTTLGPRQQIKPAPMAQHALTVGVDAVGSAQIVDGSIGGADVASGVFWSTSGNAANSGDFLGTTNTEPLELRVANQPVTRIFDAEDGSGNHAPNLIAGSQLNVLDESGGPVYGATIIGGGGDPSFNSCGPSSGSPCVNTVSQDFATVVGGYGNYATGLQATAMGVFTTASGFRSTAMGQQTIASGDRSTAMGIKTTASGASSTAMGRQTTASGARSMAMGTRAKAMHYGTFVWADDTSADFASTAEDQFLIRASGGVGIRTNSPVTQLDVSRNIGGAAATSNHVASFVNEATASGDVLALKSNATQPGAAENYITFRRDGSDIGAIQGNGDTSGGIELISGGGDFAEWLPRSDPGESIAAADIVGVFAGEVTHRTEGAQRLLVVSENAVVVGNSPPGQEDPEDHEKVAFLGQVPVNVRGPVAPGDWIVASGRGDGTGRAVAPDQWRPDEYGPIVGQAWEGAAGEGVEPVNVAVGLDATGSLAATLQAQQNQLRTQRTRIKNLQGKVADLQNRQRDAISELRRELVRLRTELGAQDANALVAVNANDKN